MSGMKDAPISGAPSFVKETLATAITCVEEWGWYVLAAIITYYVIRSMNPWFQKKLDARNHGRSERLELERRSIRLQQQETWHSTRHEVIKTDERKGKHMTEEQRRMDRLYNEARKAKLAAEKEARDNNPEDILGEGFYRARQDKKGGGGKGGGTGGGSGGFRPYVKPAAPSRRKMG